MITFTTILADFDSSLWGNYLPVDREIADQILEGHHDRRIVCTINDQVSFQCALMPKGDGNYYILVNKSNKKKAGIQIGQEVMVSLKKDESTYGLPMPDELAEVLASDPEGDELFHALTPGKQRNLLYVAGSVKSSELRIQKALVIVEHLKKQGGKINFRQLYEELKASNRRF